MTVKIKQQDGSEPTIHKDIASVDVILLKGTTLKLWLWHTVETGTRAETVMVDTESEYLEIAEG